MRANSIKQFIVVGILLCAASTAMGQDHIWIGTTGNWGTGSNWSSGEPFEWRDAFIDNGGTAQITSTGEKCYNLYLGTASGESGYVSMSSGSLTSTESILVGNRGTAVFTQNNGTVTTGGFNYALSLGNFDGGNGTYNLNGGTLSTAGGMLQVGRYGTGTFHHTAGNNYPNSMMIGHQNGSSGSYHLSGTGNIDASEIYVGTYGPGQFTQNGGTNSMTETLLIGYDSDVTGTYTLNSGSLTSGNTAHIGFGGTATFTQTGGTHTNNGKINIGATSVGQGTYTISGGTLYGEDLVVGWSGTGTFKVTGDDATIYLDTYTQNDKSTLITELDADGISLIDAWDTAVLDGTWTITNLESIPYGKYDVLKADDGISGAFDTINLPSADWAWGITPDSTTLWVEYTPEPTTISLLALGSLAVLRRKRQ